MKKYPKQGIFSLKTMGIPFSNGRVYTRKTIEHKKTPQK